MKRTLAMTTGVGAACEKSCTIANCEAPAKTRRLIAMDAPIHDRLRGDDQTGHRRRDFGTGRRFDLALEGTRLELPRRSADARPHDAVARRGGSMGTVDEPAVRLVAGRDAVARVHIRAASKETHGLFAGAFAEDDRRRAALADAPGARAGPWIAAIARA